MRAAAGDHDALDESLAGETRFAGAHVDAKLELEEPFFAVGIDVIRYGRAAGFDGFLEDLAHRLVEFAQLIARDGVRPAARTDAGAEKRLVSIDIADSAQQLLIQ